MLIWITQVQQCPNTVPVLSKHWNLLYSCTWRWNLERLSVPPNVGVWYVLYSRNESMANQAIDYIIQISEYQPAIGLTLQCGKHESHKAKHVLNEKCLHHDTIWWLFVIVIGSAYPLYPHLPRSFDNVKITLFLSVKYFTWCWKRAS